MKFHRPVFPPKFHPIFEDRIFEDPRGVCVFFHVGEVSLHITLTSPTENTGKLGKSSSLKSAIFKGSTR